VAVAIALIAIAVVIYAGRRLWLKSDEVLRPVIVTQSADVATMLRPSIGTRLRAITGGRPSPAERPKLIALTFDDGPYPVTTPLLLQTLHDLGVPATFFLIGRDAEQFPDLAREIRSRGFEIADHTLTHPNLDQLGSAEVAAELRGGRAMLQRIAPDPAETHLFRPPHGRYTAETIKAAQASGYDTVLWTDDPGDWRSVGPQTLLAHSLTHATAPEIILLHSGRPATITMLPELVTRYRQAGYSFVTVGSLLQRISPAELNRPAKVTLPAS
jgi:peptidoglycan-N-acetylglucosamine deacetylase